MKALRNLPIRRKLLFALTGICATALILCVAAIIAFEFLSYKNRAASNLASEADMLMVVLGTGLEFGDVERAEEVLGKLKAVPTIESALLLDAQTNTFAAYKRAADSQLGAPNAVDGVVTGNDGATLTRTLTSEREVIGRLVLTSNFSDLRARILRQMKILAGLLIVLLILASFLAWVLQRLVTEPITALAGVADRLAEDENYPGRVHLDTTDEVGRLTQAFNRMLDNSQDRERALRASEERFRAFMDNNPASAFLKDRESRYVYGNAGWAAKIGKPVEELNRRTDDEIWPRETRDIFQKCEAGIEEGKPSIAVEEIILPSGKREWWTLIHFRIQEPSGEHLTGGIGLDITSLKEAEEIRKLNVELERRVNQRTEQLEQKNKELESFSYSVSHDLRAPLRNMGGFVELLTGELGDVAGEPRRYMGIIRDEAKRMGQLIDDLLLFSRIGRAEMNMARVDCNRMVKEVIGGMRNDLKDRQIDWKIAPLPPVLGDYNLLRQVYANLIGNAVKFTRDRAPAIIEIGHEIKPDQLDLIVFHTKDNGAGFNSKYLDKLFGVFQRLHSAKQFEGTGIGLANVKTIVERHGGHVWAHGEPDQGAAFFFSLPAWKE